MAHNIFISYRRINGDIMARMICDGLRATNRYDSIYLDVDDHTAGDYIQTIDAHIKNSHTCIVVLSKGALDRCVEEDDIVRHEIVLAKECGLKIVPIMITGNDFAFNDFPKDLPPDIAFIRTQNACIYHQATSSHYIEDLCSFIDGNRPGNRGESSNEVQADHSGQPAKKKKTIIILLPILFIILVSMVMLTRRGGTTDGETLATAGESVSAPQFKITGVSNEENVTPLKSGYSSGGRSWNDPDLLISASDQGSTVVEGDISTENEGLVVCFAPYKERFPAGTFINLSLVDMETGNILAEADGIDSECDIDYMYISAEDLKSLRIVAAEQGNGKEASILFGFTDFTEPYISAGKTERTRSVKLGSRPVANSFSYWTFSIPYLAFGKDWMGAHLYCTRLLYETAFADYELNGKYRKLSFDYLPYADEFYDNEEYGPNRMQISVINAKTGEILGNSEWITKNSEPGHLEVDVSSVDLMRITARRDGPVLENVDPNDFSSNLLISNEILEP